MTTLDTIDLDALATISGGMRWEDFRPSENVDDVRRAPRHRQPRPRYMPPPLIMRRRGDMPSDAGLDVLHRWYGGNWRSRHL